MLRMMTIAPEEAGAIALVHALVGRKVIASIGHSAATCEEAARGISAGINHATHIFNAMRGSDGSDEGVAGAVLYDRKVFAEVILDLVHVSRASFALLMRAKYPDKAILITDSVKALRQNGVKKSLGAYRFADGRLAGSALTMIAAVKNAVKRCGLSLADAVRLATLNPARLLGLDRSKGSIKPGNDADIVIFDKDFNVKMTIVRGKIMYRTKGF
jgi:N-acetylglucosamine-6-phosphate deacetylase